MKRTAQDPSDYLASYSLQSKEISLHQITWKANKNNIYFALAVPKYYTYE